MLFLLGCPAEQLGVELPPAGDKAISHEDLRRDTRILVDGPAGDRFVERLAQMQMTETGPPDGLPKGTRCGARGEGADTRWVAPFPGNADNATAAAALISLAKAWDLDGGPPSHVTLCLLPAGAPAEAPPGDRVVGALAAGKLVFDGEGVHADPASADRTPGQVNYTELQARVQAIYVHFGKGAGG